ncbi:OprD family porin [Aliarcobacter cibarius]|uniref:OprD family porin n=1 Tax=Aliarcobacter cibarius TaxID=255507 RepID=A0ABY2V3J0_9BACT|nr:OprD family porin [Aliarcobacter cibarius]TLS97241.1 OprD family porin [Aliarcobacter cibarius]TLS97809.1 OprD family porin [Aliarcobacter cibarius]
MKKVIKTSVISALAIATSLTNLSANDLSKAFADGKIKGEIKSVYSSSNFLGNTKTDNISTIGGSLGYVTGDFYGFSAGATFQASHVIDDRNKNNVFKDDLDASGAVLSEAYLNYKLSNTSVKVGRQFIYTPLVSSAITGKSSESLVKDSFEAYLITNTDIPNTTITAGYVDKYQGKTDGDTDIGKFENFEDGAYTLYVKNNSIENLEIQAQYLNVDGVNHNSDIDNVYLQADYKISAHTLSAQYLLSKDEAQGSDKEDGQLFGIKATGPLGIGNLGYLTAFNSSTKDGAVNLGLGDGNTDTPFTAMPVNGGGVPTRGNTDTLVGAIIVPIYDVTVIPYAGYSWSNYDALGDVAATGIMAIYPFYKNFLLKASYEYVNVENVVPDENTNVTRVYLSYNF